MDPDTLWKELCMGLRGGAGPGAERGKKILLQQMGLLQQYFVLSGTDGPFSSIFCGFCHFLLLFLQDEA